MKTVDRRILSSSLSARVIEYLVHERRHTQVEIARMLGVSEGFISLVKSRERSLTLDHIERIADTLHVPIGAFLTAVTPLPENATEDVVRLHQRIGRIIKAADAAREAILRDRDNAPR